MNQPFRLSVITAQNFPEIHSYCILQPDFKIIKEYDGYSCHREVVSEVCISGRAKPKKLLHLRLVYNYTIKWIEEDHEMTKSSVDEHGLVEGAKKSKREYRL